MESFSHGPIIRPPNKNSCASSRVRKVVPMIHQLRSLNGTAAVSIGVIHQGKTIYKNNFGSRDVAKKLAPDCDTVYPIASMTKAMVAALFAHLVHRGVVCFDTKLRDLVPEYRVPYEDLQLKELATEANVIDLLAHRLGLAMGNNLWAQKNQICLARKSETAKIVGSLQPLKPFRASFIYHNWGYGLAGEILEHLTGEELDLLAANILFEPLGMWNTTLGIPRGENIAKCYMALTDGIPYEIPSTAYVAGSARAAAGACKSSINDLLRLYGSWMEAAEHQSTTGQTSTHGSPIKHAESLWQKHNSMNEDADYGLGWVMTTLPARLGQIGMNQWECPQIPVTAKGCSPQRVIYHQGSVSGALSAVYLLPATRTAVVVLTNSCDACDTADWIAQAILEAILDVPEPNDYVHYAKMTVANALSHYPATNELLLAKRIHGTVPRDLGMYTGRYYNQSRTLFLHVRISEDGNGLDMACQGYRGVTYALSHYHHDVFWWPCDRDADSKEALFPAFHYPDFHKISFQTDKSGRVVSLNWRLDRAIEEGENFYKR